MKLENRSATKTEDAWNVESVFATYDDWELSFKNSIDFNTSNKWPEITKLKGQLAQGPDKLKKLFDLVFKIDRQLSLLYTYAHLRHDENITDDRHKIGLSQITSILHEFGQALSWIEPELLALPDETISSYLDSEILKDYRFHLEKIVRLKPHTLSSAEESLLALSAQALDGYHKAFSAINDADFNFGTVVNSEGKELMLSHGTYGMYLRDQDRKLRKNTFFKMHEQYEKYENTLCELLSGLTQKHTFLMRAQKYNSCLEASLFPKNIDTSVYHSLIKAVNDNISTLHKYMDLRKSIMQVSELHLYDTSVPLTKEFDIKMPFDQASDLIIESVAPLGSEYQNILAEGLKKDRWVDRYENKGKRSGGYSSGCYDTMPFILMNYKNILRDVFTLAHEAGHSMHSYLSHKNQPYQYGDYPIFLAEVASTFNEELLMQLMLKKASSKEEKIYLLNMKIEDIRATLFRQTMFAEFELMIHTKTEKNQPLTPQTLKEEFQKLNQTYFGPQVVIDPIATIEWARIPHFYYNFYVYQYATGISAALALCERVVNGGDQEKNDYLNFLKSGCSRYPVETLKLAGVDMSSSAPVESAIRRFDNLVTELKNTIFE